MDQESPMMTMPLDESGQGFQEKETALTAGANKGNYRSGEVRCYNCKHFEDPNRCKKGINGGTVDPEGSSDDFEPVDEENQGSENEQSPEATEYEK